MLLFPFFLAFILCWSNLISCKNLFSQDYHILNRELNTLKLVQIIHTHGDRTPSKFVQNDPYSIVPHFWPEGIGQLTYLGKIHKFFKFF